MRYQQQDWTTNNNDFHQTDDGEWIWIIVGVICDGIYTWFLYEHGEEGQNFTYLYNADGISVIRSVSVTVYWKIGQFYPCLVLNIVPSSPAWILNTQPTTSPDFPSAERHPGILINWILGLLKQPSKSYSQSVGLQWSSKINTNTRINKCSLK